MVSMKVYKYEMPHPKKMKNMLLYTDNISNNKYSKYRLYNLLINGVDVYLNDEIIECIEDFADECI